MSTKPQTQKEYHVFLSHYSNDKDLVELIAQRLEDEANLKPFLDKWHLIPGDPWQEALEKALDGSESCAVFLGSAGLGAWENEEMRAALDERVKNEDFRVIPVLLPGADPHDENKLPRFLRRITWVDFRPGIDNHEAFHRLVAGIKGESPGRIVTHANEDAVKKQRVKYVIVFSGTINDAHKALAEGLIEHLREISRDSHLTVNKIEEGSIVLYIESSEEGFENLKSLFEYERNYFGRRMLNVQRINEVDDSVIDQETRYEIVEEYGYIYFIRVWKGDELIREIDPNSEEGLHVLENHGFGYEAAGGVA
jgi:hypothetical protein